MKLTKQQQSQLRREIKKAAVASLREYFSACEGATSRRLEFLAMFLSYSVAFMIVMFCMLSGTLLAGTFLGPQPLGLMDLNTWVAATPVHQALAESHSFFNSMAIQCAVGGPIFGAIFALERITRPATRQVKQSFGV